MILVVILIYVFGIYILFDLLIWKGWFYQMTISRIPHNDFYACRKMLFNLHKMELVEKDIISHTYHIKGSKFYMVVLGDDLYDLYHAENLKELEHSYSIGGIGLKSTWNSWINQKIGTMLYKWHTTKGKLQKENNKSKRMNYEKVD